MLIKTDCYEIRCDGGVRQPCSRTGGIALTEYDAVRKATEAGLIRHGKNWECPEHDTRPMALSLPAEETA